MNNRSLGVIILCLWAIVTGFLAVTNLTVQFAPVVLGFMLIAAGVLILLGR